MMWVLCLVERVQNRGVLKSSAVWFFLRSFPQSFSTSDSNKYRHIHFSLPSPVRSVRDISYIALLPTISSSDSSSYPVHIQDSSLHRPVLSEHVEPHASSPRLPALTSFPVEVSHSSQYVDFLLWNLEPPPALTPQENPLLHPGYYPYFIITAAQLFRRKGQHAEDNTSLQNCTVLNPFYETENSTTYVQSTDSQHFEFTDTFITSKFRGTMPSNNCACTLGFIA
jgi:hypothetical protein